MKWIHYAFRSSTLGFVMDEFIFFHGAVLGSNIMDPSTSRNPIDNANRYKTVLLLSKKNLSVGELRGHSLRHYGHKGD